MGPVDATVSVLQNFAEFSGRASRAEYWWFVLVWTVAYFAVLALQRGVGKMPEYIFIAATAVPVMSVSFRRLHDIGHSGWWAVAEVILIILLYVVMARAMPEDEDDTPEAALKPSLLITGVLSLIASIGIIWHFSLPSQPGTNQYGPNPHEVQS